MSDTTITTTEDNTVNKTDSVSNTFEELVKKNIYYIVGFVIAFIVLIILYFVVNKICLTDDPKTTEDNIVNGYNLKKAIEQILNKQTTVLNKLQMTNI